MAASRFNMLQIARELMRHWGGKKSWRKLGPGGKRWLDIFVGSETNAWVSVKSPIKTDGEDWVVVFYPRWEPFRSCCDLARSLLEYGISYPNGQIWQLKIHHVPVPVHVIYWYNVGKPTINLRYQSQPFFREPGHGLWHWLYHMSGIAPNWVSTRCFCPGPNMELENKYLIDL